MKIAGVIAVGVLLGGLAALGGGANGTAEAQGRGATASRAASDAACARLARLKLPHTTITSAKMVPAGGFRAPDEKGSFSDLPAFCRVSMMLAPSSDSDIKSEIWMPAAGWNGKFQFVGNGGWNGFIQYGEMAAALRRGYATASTDTGHTGGEARFALGHPEKLIDFGYRAVHDTAVQGKAAIAALYGAAARLSYFVGCSGGGRQGFMEAQRYPRDFQGIIAGDPGFDRTGESFELVAVAQATHRTPASRLPRAKLAVLHRAAIAACDANDGIQDGIINDPTKCRFDPGATLCKGPDAPDCLTAAQVEAARGLYKPLIDPQTGKEVFPGFEPGTELSLAANAARPNPLADQLFKYVVFKDPKWNFMTLDVSRDLPLARKIDHGVISPISPNLKPFAESGGKLIIYHGWADQNVPPLSSVDYYEEVVKTMGRKMTEDSVRLYMAPGMAHCGGGEGPNVFDVLTPLERWRERGIAPQRVVASQIENGAVIRTRPLCPYPEVAKYTGRGSTDEAGNFVCRMP